MLQVSPQVKFFQNQTADLGSKTETKRNPPTKKVLNLPPKKCIEKGNEKNKTKEQEEIVYFQLLAHR